MKMSSLKAGDKAGGGGLVFLTLSWELEMLDASSTLPLSKTR